MDPELRGCAGEIIVGGILFIVVVAPAVELGVPWMFGWLGVSMWIIGRFYLRRRYTDD